MTIHRLQLETVQFTLTDGDGGSSVSITKNITVATANDAPTIVFGSLFTMTDVVEDDVNPAGDTVAAIIASGGADPVTDVDVGAVEGIAVTGRDNTNGTWQYSTDGGSSWFDFGAVSSGNATVLDDTAMVRLRAKS